MLMFFIYLNRTTIKLVLHSIPTRHTSVFGCGSVKIQSRKISQNDHAIALCRAGNDLLIRHAHPKAEVFSLNVTYSYFSPECVWGGCVWGGCKGSCQG